MELWRVIGLTLSILISIQTRVVAADKPVKVNKQNLQNDASRHFQNGVRLYSLAKYDEALAEFERAYSIAPHPSVLYNLAVSNRELSLYEESIQYFEQFLKQGRGVVSKTRLNQAENELKNVMVLIAKISIDSNPPDALIKIDGREFGTTPLRKSAIVGPGTHTIEAFWIDKFEKKQLNVASGDEISVMLAPVAPTISPPTMIEPKTSPIIVMPTKPEVSSTPINNHKKFRLSAGFGFTFNQFGENGAPIIGLGYSPWKRIMLGTELVLIAWAIVPSIRCRLFGETLSVHAIVASPVDLSGDETRLSVAGGFGIKFLVSDALSFQAESMVAYRDRASYPTFLNFVLHL